MKTLLTTIALLICSFLLGCQGHSASGLSSKETESRIGYNKRRARLIAELAKRKEFGPWDQEEYSNEYLQGLIDRMPAIAEKPSQFISWYIMKFPSFPGNSLQFQSLGDMVYDRERQGFDITLSSGSKAWVPESVPHVIEFHELKIEEKAPDFEKEWVPE